MEAGCMMKMLEKTSSATKRCQRVHTFWRIMCPTHIKELPMHIR